MNEKNPWMAHSDMFQSLSFIRILKIQCASHKLKFIFNVECKAGRERAREATKQKHATKRSTEVVNHFQRHNHKWKKEKRMQYDLAAFDPVKVKE